MSTVRESAATSNNSSSEFDLALDRLIHAPREVVFDAWTSPEILRQWWGPIGFTTTTEEFSLQPGGMWRLTMHGPDGGDYPSEITFREVVRPERLVYLHDCNASLVTVTFADQDGKTLVAIRSKFGDSAGIDAAAMRGLTEGWQSTLDRLDQIASRPH